MPECSVGFFRGHISRKSFTSFLSSLAAGFTTFIFGYKHISKSSFTFSVCADGLQSLVVAAIVRLGLIIKVLVHVVHVVVLVVGVAGKI